MSHGYSSPAKRSHTGFYVLGCILAILGAVGGAVWYYFPSVPELVSSSLDPHAGATLTLLSHNKLSFVINDITSNIEAFGEVVATLSAQDVLLAADSRTTFTMPVQDFNPTIAIARHCKVNSSFPATITTRVKVSLWDLFKHKGTLPQEHITFPCPTPGQVVELLGQEAAYALMQAANA